MSVYDPILGYKNVEPSCYEVEGMKRERITTLNTRL